LKDLLNVKLSTGLTPSHTAAAEEIIKCERQATTASSAFHYAV